MNKYLREHREAVTEAVEQLWTYNHLTPANYTEIKNYVAELEGVIRTIEFTFEESDDDEVDKVKLSARLQEAQAESQWFKDNVQIYTSTRVSIHRMQDLVRHMLWNSAEFKKSHEDAFFDMKELVEIINCFYDIKEPYKPSNKIAYGWNFAMSKSNFRPYLFGCIRNYLRRNNVEFTTSDLQKICCLKDITDEDC